MINFYKHKHSLKIIKNNIITPWRIYIFLFTLFIMPIIGCGEKIPEKEDTDMNNLLDKLIEIYKEILDANSGKDNIKQYKDTKEKLEELKKLKSDFKQHKLPGLSDGQISKQTLNYFEVKQKTYTSEFGGFDTNTSNDPNKMSVTDSQKEAIKKAFEDIIKWVKKNENKKI